MSALSSRVAGRVKRQRLLGSDRKRRWETKAVSLAKGSCSKLTATSSEQAAIGLWISNELACGLTSSSGSQRVCWFRSFGLL